MSRGLVKIVNDRDLGAWAGQKRGTILSSEGKGRVEVATNTSELMKSEEPIIQVNSTGSNGSNVAKDFQNNSKMIKPAGNTRTGVVHQLANPCCCGYSMQEAIRWAAIFEFVWNIPFVLYLTVKFIDTYEEGFKIRAMVDSDKTEKQRTQQYMFETYSGQLVCHAIALIAAIFFIVAGVKRIKWPCYVWIALIVITTILQIGLAAAYGPMDGINLSALGILFVRLYWFYLIYEFLSEVNEYPDGTPMYAQKYSITVAQTGVPNRGITGYTLAYPPAMAYTPMVYGVPYGYGYPYYAGDAAFMGLGMGMGLGLAGGYMYDGCYW